MGLDRSCPLRARCRLFAASHRSANTADQSRINLIKALDFDPTLPKRVKNGTPFQVIYERLGSENGIRNALHERLDALVGRERLERWVFFLPNLVIRTLRGAKAGGAK